MIVLNIKAVLFDLGNTLVKTWAPEATIHGVLASLGIDRAVEEIREALLRTEEEFRESGYRSLYGKADYVEYWEKWNSQVLRNLGISGNNYLAKEILIRWFDHADCVIYPDAEKTLVNLKQTGLKLGLISTAYEEDIAAILQRANLDRSFSDVIVGANTLMKEKPHPDVFKYALRKLSVEPEAALFVGDHAKNDYEGARAVGMRALLIQIENQNSESVSGFRRISSLEDVYTFID